MAAPTNPASDTGVSMTRSAPNSVIKPFVDRMKSFYEAKRKAGKLPKGFLEAVEATRAGS